MPNQGKLTPQEKFAARLLATGFSIKQVLDETSINPSALKKCLNLPLFQHEIKLVQDDVFTDVKEKLVARLEKAQLPALERMITHSEAAEAESVSFNATKWLLEAGPLAPQKGAAVDLTIQQNSINLGPAELQAIIAGSVKSFNSPTLEALHLLAKAKQCPSPQLLPSDSSSSLDMTLQPSS